MTETADDLPGRVEDRHLDLGCGTVPRNPYGRSRLFGVDIRPEGGGSDAVFRAANLTFDAIPFPDGAFASVSAFDFLEHVPRLMPGPEPRTTVFPFLRLMDEVWRVLAPGGTFWALTPCYPGAEAFVDPTHVNVITDRTHAYFCREGAEEPKGRMYGFRGTFEALRAEWAIPELARTTAPLAPMQEFRRRQRAKKGKLVYFLWELRAVK
jgi:SAM-dependent methyltransferase